MGFLVSPIAASLAVTLIVVHVTRYLRRDAAIRRMRHAQRARERRRG
ncbi:hypothetical protein [uncultured Sphingomonas sp.]|nr:hypothetical protein [uncultured Sphingomonas sp.]